MGKLFTLTPDILATIQVAFDDLIGELGRTCRMVYPPNTSRCPNCVFDPINKKSTNVYLTGGPYPFPTGTLCPVCFGKGIITEEAYDDVNLLIQEDASKFQKIGNLNIPDGSIQTKGFVSDLQKILRCNYMIKHIDMSPILTQKYKLFGEPVCPGNIVQARYFVCIWQRID